jgi:Ca2+:H+ antiporter
MSAAGGGLPAWSWAAPVAAAILLASHFAGVAPYAAPWFVALAAALLGGSVFAAVHHAEVLALRLGEPFGSILLAVAVTVIEVALIVSIMLQGAPGADAVARDTVFAAVMIVLNGIVGACLLLGGGRHREQTFRLDGATAALAVIGTLATLALILPNHTLEVLGPVYSPVQLLFVGAVSLALYGIFVFIQTVRHREYFLEAAEAKGVAAKGTAAEGVAEEELRPSGGAAALSLGLLLVALVSVVLLAKVLSPSVERGIAAAGLPKAFVGVVIAAIVLLPEGLASMRAALANRLQTSLNLALGSSIASIGLTIPTVAVVSILLDQRLILGLTSENTVLLMLTLFISALTLGTGRTTVLQGAVHLVIFSVFILFSALS